MAYPLVSEALDCRSCYKCIRVCPTKSIAFRDSVARIIQDGCVYCGRCYLACPQGAKKIRNDIGAARSLIQSGHCVASVAPSYLSAFPEASFASLKRALIQLGFEDAEETAIGATIVKRLYDEEVAKAEKDVIISTCCHSVNLTVEKYYPELIGCLAPYLSPMLAHARDIKERKPGHTVIFIGPCISKKDEIDVYKGYDDCVLTFLELKKMLEEDGIAVEAEEAKPLTKSKARVFPTDGGILKTMDRPNSDYVYLPISGMDEVRHALDGIKEGKIHKAFIEMSGCTGSCINGPAIDAKRPSLKAYLDTVRSAGKEDFEAKEETALSIKKEFRPLGVIEAEPSEEEIRHVLHEIGKSSKADELNCACCGYKTCREKAKAVITGKANLEMCLPYLMGKARSFSNSIVSSSNNGIIVASEDLTLQLVNPKMGELLNIKDTSVLIHSNLASILNPEPFVLALNGTPIINKREYLSDYGRFTELTITHDKEYHILIGIYRDVTEARKRRIATDEKTKETVAIADEVVAKHMKAVQEIALLLGESAADTKVALNKLKAALEKGRGDE